jgi:lipoyl(octanoyl) transferase
VPAGLLNIVDLGRMAYGPAYEVQMREHAAVLAARDAAGDAAGTLIFVEHDPVITVSNRPSAGENLLATAEMLDRAGVAVTRTDRGGDITYHGPGQLVVYPILDLNLLNLGLHDYMRLLEGAVIETCAAFGVAADREEKATGVWVRPRGGEGAAKVCAMGVRVRRWVSMHGLALNVTTNLEHFALINPCGLGRPVTSLSKLLGAGCPEMTEVKRVLGECLEGRVARAMDVASEKRAGAETSGGGHA